jgi:hypothetical protein
MEDTVRRLAHVLGATGVESVGHDARFVVDSEDGCRLTVSLGGEQQRFMAVLRDKTGVTRADLDVAPVTKVSEHPDFPGRVTLHVGHLLIHVEARPSLAIEVLSEES